MKIKKNYFLRNCVDLAKSLSDYLTDADNNYVILNLGEPLVWGDKSPVIFGDEMALLNELGEIGGLSDDGERLCPEYEVLTEQDFIYRYCLDGLAEWFKAKAKEIGENDGVCNVIWLDKTFNNFVPAGKVCDVLGIYNSLDSDGLSFLVSDSEDSLQVWFTLDDFYMNEIIDFVKYVEKETVSE